MSKARQVLSKYRAATSRLGVLPNVTDSRVNTMEWDGVGEGGVRVADEWAVDSRSQDSRLSAQSCMPGLWLLYSCEWGQTAKTRASDFESRA